MKILVLGGDGFCGWPTSLQLSRSGHEVIIVDNLKRREIDVELGVSSLTPILPLDERLEAWEEITGARIPHYSFNIAKDYDPLLSLLEEFRPDSIVHFAEQKSAPYSMKSSKHKRFTLDNNLNATNNVLAAIVEAELNSHLVHLGTMGVYGYGFSGIKIPEGYLEIRVEDIEGKEVKQEILYPAYPGSIYHMTKTQDQLLFSFYNMNDDLKITDLHQGIVWGTQTEETRLDPRLINRFDYDGDFGTVFNRFLMQSAIDYPLTVHGSGGQTRAFINIQDTVKCIALAIENPPQTGERVLIMNQMTEIHRIIDLAELVSRLTGTPIQHLENLRNEADQNDLVAESKTLPKLGLNPITIEDGLLMEIRETAKKYKDRCNSEKILSVSAWRRT